MQKYLEQTRQELGLKKSMKILMLTKIQKKVFNLLKKIPKGKVTTYKILARTVGQPKNWRQIGKILSQNPYPQKIPCYKVVKTNGEIGGYKLGVLTKKKLLRKDGLIISNNRIKNFNDHLFNF